MSYYQGDFYRGDPGFFSFLGRIGKGLLGAVLPGGGGGGGLVRGTTVPAGAMSAVRASAGAMVKRGMGAIIKHPVLSAAGAAGAVGVMGAAGGRAVARRGMRAAAGMRRHRRMNVCNPRALRRSIRRTQGFAKLAMRTIHLVHPKKKARFGGFKRRTKKRA
jgi:hypothetical protein